ncbi:hypothetical protein ACSU6B_23845 [Neobacillus sp. C211]|nr:MULTISPECIES: hypothetical protein [unclassified Bacillus (in: firmicutes)]MBT2700212.1 hypothetical protein [Bacillus sp. ISL-40]MBT2728871.1 hypothetical protein [Bacillus sp. ISL-75]MBT2737427.1 hypothetical protein [Bacillus sp. ISL-7]MBT2740497.1 hypothetical protein [Bacillus sp. ISL-77]
MKVEYKYNEQLLDLKETANGDDFEFTLTFVENKWKKKIEEIRGYFDSNNILTDIHFYIHPNNRFQIIVRKDFYNEFIIQLFRQQIVKEIKWI